jgi:cytochrome c55X
MWRRITACVLSTYLPAAMCGEAVPDAGRQAELRNLLQQDCGSCHGLTLKGGLGPALLPQDLVGKPREMLLLTVRDGRPGTAMPPWGGLLSDADIGWLVDRLLAGDGVSR